MGYDDEAQYSVPPFTSVSLSVEEIARTAVVNLARQIVRQRLGLGNSGNAGDS